MAIKLTLNKKNDQLVPTNALQKWSAEHLNNIQDETVLNKLFDKAAKRPKNFREKAGELNNIIKKLPAPTEEKGGRVWFLKVFLEPFGGDINDEAKETFEVLSKGWFGGKSSFAELERATEEYNGNLKTATTAVANSAVALNKILTEELGPAVAEFATAYKQAKTAAAATPAAQAQPAVAPPQTQAGTVNEAIKREIALSKKLLEFGFITENEHLAKLVEAKNKSLGRRRSRSTPRPHATPITGAPATQTPAGITPAAVTNPVVKAQKTPPAPPPQPVAPSPEELAQQALDAAHGDAKIPVTKPSWQEKLADLVQPPPAPAGAQPQTAQPTAAPAAAVTEAKNLKRDKKLFELGFITENEYLASLVQTKRMLSEDATADVTARLTAAGFDPTKLDNVWLGLAQKTANQPKIDPEALRALNINVAQPQKPPPPEEGNDPIDKGVVTLIGKSGAKGDDAGEVTKLAERASGIQDAMTRFAKEIVTESLSLKEKQLATLHVKKQVLTEFTKTGALPTRTQLNEFVIASLLLAALAGAMAWAASKFGAMFKDAYPSKNTAPSHRSAAGDSKTQLESIATGLAAGIDAQGNLVDSAGRQVPALSETLTKFVTGISKVQDAITAGVTELGKPNNITDAPGTPVAPALVKTEQAAKKVNPAVTDLMNKLQALISEASKN
jgi:hypothetical protein